MLEKFSQNQAQSRWIQLTQNIYFLEERDKSAQPIRKLAQSCPTYKMVLLLFYYLCLLATHCYGKLALLAIQCYGKTSSDCPKQFQQLQCYENQKVGGSLPPSHKPLFLQLFSQYNTIIFLTAPLRDLDLRILELDFRFRFRFSVGASRMKVAGAEAPSTSHSAHACTLWPVQMYFIPTDRGHFVEVTKPSPMHSQSSQYKLWFPR